MHTCDSYRPVAINRQWNNRTVKQRNNWTTEQKNNWTIEQPNNCTIEQPNNWTVEQPINRIFAAYQSPIRFNWFLSSTHTRTAVPKRENGASATHGFQPVYISPKRMDIGFRRVFIPGGHTVIPKVRYKKGFPKYWLCPIVWLPAKLG